MILHAALTAIALAAPGGAPQASGAAQVSGMVLDSAGLPLADVCIGSMHSDDGKFDVFDAPFPDQTNCTGEDGAFTLRVAPGNVAVVAALYRDQITLRLTPVKVAASRTTVTVRFDASSSIRVRALDPAGRPLRGVRVTALPERPVRTRRGETRPSFEDGPGTTERRCSPASLRASTASSLTEPLIGAWKPASSARGCGPAPATRW